jgi:hypothetical protein
MSLHQNLLPQLEAVAEILALKLKTYHLNGVCALNYYYWDQSNQKVSFLGTEPQWLAQWCQEGWPQKINQRAHELGQSWSMLPELTQAYASFRRQKELTAVVEKTDLCLEGRHGFHILEITHTKALQSHQLNRLFDLISLFKDESIRLAAYYPLLQQTVPWLPKPECCVEPHEPVYDLDQIIEADPLPLNAEETQALTLRVQWHQDDEIARAMRLSLAQVQALFQSIGAKHHHPYIPDSVYRRHLHSLYPHWFEPKSTETSKFPH